MFKKLIQYFRGFQKEVGKEQLLTELERIDKDIISGEERLKAINNFWQLINLDELKTLTIRKMIGVPIYLRHYSIGYLLDALTRLNDHIANEDDLKISEMCRTEFIDRKSIDLDEYFINSNDSFIDVCKSIETMRDLIWQQTEYLEQINHQAYQRQMDRMYYDIIELSRAIIKLL
ncbi:hypothetical protein KEN51_CDS0217 [Pseudomonas phage vB_Pae10145-KEN51]